ncbi:glycine--tRNA ligase subunit beta [Erythrobacter insulae]|uniref:Glycine--tRNA ligase beta subunit n=1 Tax=Erythrobacter insulae TaxID=2584124 RepID=A0A547P797_9SPHN|nr:glycine--tRNA ligase subunit beta [Erythrobacter insulae]TRD09894.1 glycine--tRNA ligase subunit beta [Erythrobacter insulae]
MADFLLELRSEEIPARMQKGARAELEKLLRREMDAAGVAAGELTVWSTPRRLALIARGLPTETKAVREEAKGPPVGAPDQAVDGFCRKNGVDRDALEVRDVKGRETYFAVIEKPGQAVTDLLAAAIPAIIRDFSWPKSMRWGDASISSESLKWVRPLSGVVALLDGEVVPVVLDGMASGRETFGHRFHSAGALTIANADEYASTLRAASVIVDHEERQNTIREGAKAAAEAAGLKLVEDEGLVVENAGLTEWPVPLLGRFEDDFLDVPPETIQLTARVNQKYFVCEDADGNLANAFICTANIAAADPAVVVDGNRKVLAARLSDARFFWELDQKKTLAEHAKGLERITFHEKLGTVADKVERVAKLARWLCEEGIVKGDPDLAEQAARLCKADLVTEMVGEFPELQGLMGGYYAAKEGLPVEVSDAIRDHYKPVGQGDDVPTAPVTVAVSLADKLDSVMQFFFIDEKPTGSKDPFALRRAAISIVRLVLRNELRLPVFMALAQSLGASVRQATTEIEAWSSSNEAKSFLLADLVDTLETSGSAKLADRSHDQVFIDAEDVQTLSGRANHVREFMKQGLKEFGRVNHESVDFVIDRLKVQQREAGVRHDLIDAVFALGGEDDLVRLLARVHALQAFVETEDGTNLLAGYKRAANILKKEEWESKDVSYSPEPAEKALIDALDAAEPKAAEAIEAEDFAAAMSALATLRAPIDRFFEDVIVNADESHIRAARLDLLARFRDAVHRVADFSRIEG